MSSIDVNEILRSSLQPPEKKQRLNAVSNISTANATAAEILAALEQDDSHQATIDDQTVKRISLQLEKKCAKNREQRIKYADEPQKFMDSEEELNNAIQEMHVVAAQPDLYGVLVEAGVVPTLLQLLAHENTDIVTTICNLLQELTDIEILHESEEGAEVLIDELLKSQVIETLVQQAINRLNEEIQDEADATHNALSVIENLLDFRPDASTLCVEQGLFQWLLTRATKKGQFDANKLFASQLLASLLQSTEEARKKLTEKVDGIDLLLRALASYKRHDPGSPDEFEHMENLFDALCASLLYAANRQVFLDGEGLQLMNLILREKKQSRDGALKVLSYATAIPDGGANCDKFVEILGLKTLFPLFMRTPPRVKRKDSTPDDHEEYCCSVVDALLFLCSEQNRQRVAQKFADHGYEKVDRAIELFMKYSERVQKFINKTSKSKTLADLDTEELYVEKLNSGLYTLQRIAFIIAEVCANGSPGCRERALKMMRMKLKNQTLSDLLEPILREFHENLGEDADFQKIRVERLIINLQNE
ncbi:catenin-beta-like, arm-motif containing nuclear domain-containing protein [Ditylenchus destructor]|nr:catenin-beta-like, arm-motif containing nuclear domain-containing protein [Ditylenchus destructor]